MDGTPTTWAIQPGPGPVFKVCVQRWKEKFHTQEQIEYYDTQSEKHYNHSELRLEKNGRDLKGLYFHYVSGKKNFLKHSLSVWKRQSNANRG